MLILASLAALYSISADVVAHPIPGCGVAAVYSYLRSYNVQVSLHDVDQAVHQLRPGVDPFNLSVADVQASLAFFGTRAVCVRTSPEKIASLPMPCILYFRPGRWPRNPSQETGHFATLLNVVDQQAVMLDWSAMSTQSAIRVATADLATAWDGDAIVPDDYMGRVWQILVGIGITIVGVSLLMHHYGASSRMMALFRSMRRLRFSAAATTGALLCVCSGCGQGITQATIDESPLTFNQRLANLGNVPGTSLIQQEFAFRVWDREPVTIEGFEASCGCTVPDKDLVGKALPPGSEHVLRISVRPDGEGAPVTRLVKVRTTPSSNAPLVLGVRYIRQDRPRLSASRMTIDVAVESAPSAEFDVTYRRLPDAPKVLLDSSKSFGSDFEIVDLQHKSEIVTPNATTGLQMAVDTSKVKLRARRAFSYGEHSSELKLVFSDRSTQALPIVVRVQHPLQLRLARVFCGTLRPGQEWSKSIKCDISKGVGFSVAGVVAHGAGIQARFSDTDRLVVSGIAPESTGRFEGEVVLTFSPPEIPELRVPVAGIVDGSPQK